MDGWSVAEHLPKNRYDEILDEFPPHISADIAESG
jgi:hypothetical protein